MLGPVKIAVFLTEIKHQNWVGSVDTFWGRQQKAWLTSSPTIPSFQGVLIIFDNVLLSHLVPDIKKYDIEGNCDFPHLFMLPEGESSIMLNAT
jgi:hypothetical protein